jgi:hypothetical protein
MSYRDKKDIGPSTEEIASANGPFGIIVVLLIVIVIAIASLAQWLVT